MAVYQIRLVNGDTVVLESEKSSAYDGALYFSKEGKVIAEFAAGQWACWLLDSKEVDWSASRG